jgi:hypothetical protein
MRSYLGFTCHYMSVENMKLQSSLLCCTRFKGSHNGERIAAEIEAILELYGIKQKLDYVITDNAANMKKALTIAFMNNEVDDDNEDVPDVDHADVWQSIDDEDEQEVLDVLTIHSRKERLACFDHTLHLVVGDGLRDTKCVSASIAKCCKLASLLHSSSLFKDAFETAFGSNASISASVTTRWNSVLRQIKSITALDSKQLCDVLEAQGQKNLIFSARELAQLHELVDILDPFLEATCITEGDKVVTISYALPSVLALIQHLQAVKQRLKFCNPICLALLASMNTRFDGMLKRVQVPMHERMADDITVLVPFRSDIYIIAAFFDPKFKLKWIDNGLKLNDKDKEDLREEVKGND